MPPHDASGTFEPLLLEALLLVMLDLLRDVSEHSWLLGLADREGRIASLPRKRPYPLLLHPFRGAFLHVPDDIGDADREAEREERVDVIRDSPRYGASCNAGCRKFPPHRHEATRASREERSVHDSWCCEVNEDTSQRLGHRSELRPFRAHHSVTSGYPGRYPGLPSCAPSGRRAIATALASGGHVNSSQFVMSGDDSLPKRSQIVTGWRSTNLKCQFGIAAFSPASTLLHTVNAVRRPNSKSGFGCRFSQGWDPRCSEAFPPGGSVTLSRIA
jgi:hypothetical protein